METMASVWNDRDQGPDSEGLGKECEGVMDRLFVQRETLRKEVEKYCAERGVDVSKV